VVIAGNYIASNSYGYNYLTSCWFNLKKNIYWQIN